MGQQKGGVDLEEAQTEPTGGKWNNKHKILNTFWHSVGHSLHLRERFENGQGQEWQPHSSHVAGGERVMKR